MNHFVFGRSDLVPVINSPVCDNNRHNVCKISGNSSIHFFPGLSPLRPRRDTAFSRLVTPVLANRRAAPVDGAGQWLRVVGVSVGCEVRFVEFAK